jgi:pSer/pThr/pTyr-binding forkhead associated (FHA) protein
MLRILVLTGARAGARFELAAPIIRIGRAPDCEIALDATHDLDASGRHAEIRAEGGSWVLYDLQSRNGVFLASRGMARIQREILGENDQVQLGPQGPRLQIEVLAKPMNSTAPTGHAPGGATPTPPPYAPPTYAPPPVVAVASPMMIAPPQAPPMVPPQQLSPIAAALPGLPALPPVDSSAQTRKPMGQKTLLAHVGSMIAQQNKGRSTGEIKALVDDNVQRATKRMRMIVGAMGVLVVGAVVAIVALVATKPDDPATLRKQLEKLSMSDPKRKEIEAKLAAFSGGDANVGRAVYEENKGAIFMLVAHRGRSYDKGGFCTAFAVKPTILASNAHCAKAAQDFVDGGAKIFAHLNESNDGSSKPKMFEIKRFKGHPKYKHLVGSTITPDVGLFELADDEAPSTVTIAERPELKRLGTGDSLYALGFPGRTMDETSPVATFIPSHVGRITDALGQKADAFDDGWLVQHDGPTTPGTSGSPIFDAEKHVVAINAGALLESKGEAVYKYAMRIDLVDDIKLGDDDDKKSDDDDSSKKKRKKKASKSDDDDE